MATNPNVVAIQTVEVGSGGAAEIDFTNIPQTYTDLVIKLSVRSDRATLVDGFIIRFNNDTTSGNYSNRRLFGTGAAAVSDTSSAPVFFDASTATANTFGNAEIYIPNYTSSNAKSWSSDTVHENNATTAYAGIVAGLWTGTNAITSIKLTSETSANFVQYTTATLYGVTSAGYGAKATGGAIYQDADYFYHAFFSSGTFTPTQSLSADVLVIAGGGGGGNAFGGGGGAGGLLGFTSQSLTAQNYTITVGGGGAGSTSESSKGSNGSNSVFGSLTTCTGGGGGGSYQTTSGANGGSGGGGSGDWNGGNGTFTGGTGTSGQGFAGGDGYKLPPIYRSGGGGGSTAVGQTLTSTSGGGNGGAGTSTYSSWATATASGASGSYAGGGGGGGFGGNNLVAGTGSAGGGNGGFGAAGSNATAFTGSGGGGGSGGAAWNGGNGASGIVIVRYAK